MADRRRDVRPAVQHSETSHSAANAGWGDYHKASPLTASAQVLPHAEHRYQVGALQYDSWQEEAWDYFANLGEFNYAATWFAEALSRVRLVAAEVEPDSDEPVTLDSGPAVDLVEKLAGGTDAQAEVMHSFATQLAVVGECYMVGREVTDAELYGDTTLSAEPDEDGRIWTVQPINTLRRSPRTFRTLLGRNRRGWQLQTDDVSWIDLPRESLVTRVWNRNEHFPWLAMSPARAALPVMREIDMYNRYIMATLVSRVALNGLLLIPDEVTLPVNPEYEDAADPFISELLDIMRATIKNPGSPSSAAPLPLRAPSEYIDKFKHLTFDTPLSDKIFEMRKEAIVRLAASLNLPQEVLTGMGGVNHWGSWQLEESAIKIHIAPQVEIITRCLTSGYLHPMLRAIDEQVTSKKGNKLVIWYDTSELTQRPDRSEMAVQLRDRLVINDDATRREAGFSEDDKPSDDELEKMILQQLASNPMTFSVALKALTGLKLELPPQPTAAPNAGVDPSLESGPEGEGSAPSSERSVPDTLGEPPPPPDDSITASSQHMTQQRIAALTQLPESVSRYLTHNGER